MRYRYHRIERAVTALISGNRRPTRTAAGQAVRYAAIDGRPPDLRRNRPKNLVPLISASWGSVFESGQGGVMSDADRKQLDDMVALAHDQGRRIRFWALPSGEAIWATVYEAGVDLINADDLSGLQRFLLERSRPDDR